MDISKKLPTKIPIFPLSNFIVFPNTTVPLNIFEQRYLEMVDDSMSSNRLIGMIQPKKTSTLLNPDLYDVGCVCRIVSFNETEDGRYIIILKGLSRFKKIKEIENKKIYRELNVSYNLFANDMGNQKKDFEFSDISKLLEELKLLFHRRGYKISWKDLEKKKYLSNFISSLNGFSFFYSRKANFIRVKRFIRKKS